MTYASVRVIYVIPFENQIGGYDTWRICRTKRVMRNWSHEIAREVIHGDWGNGSDRKNQLAQAGYNYSEVQRRVNELLK